MISSINSESAFILVTCILSIGVFADSGYTEDLSCRISMVGKISYHFPVVGDFRRQKKFAKSILLSTAASIPTARLLFTLGHDIECNYHVLLPKV